jgi:FkbH-like protein
MLIRLSDFVHLMPLADDRVLVIHAINDLRLAVDKEVAQLISCFRTPKDVPEAVPELARQLGYDRQTPLGCIASLVERAILVDKDSDAERADLVARLGETHGRDPVQILERHRRQVKQGTVPYWSVTTPYRVADLDGQRRRLDVLLFGDCELQTEADFLRREAAERGIDLRVAATFPNDVSLADERAHEAIVIGALRSRNTITRETAAQHGTPYELYISEARRLIESLRARSAAPILIDNLPEPTVQPLGFADRGIGGHRNAFRQANLELARLADEFADVHVVDIAAALAAAGSERLLDDGLVSFTHFGSPGWMLQRPASEKAAVHGIFPDTAPLAQWLGGDPYAREAVTALAHLDALVVVLGIDRKKCVVVDLDGVLWPGVLAETGAPFAWHHEISGLYSYVGLYFGIHEALKALKRRGILLVSVSKNDEATVRELWRYPDHYPRDRLLQPDDFVTWRVNWNDKAENIRSIADELGLALETFVFLDDHPIERERVRTQLPEVEAWGEDLFALRRKLLTDPRLQLPRITEESASRTTLVKAQLERARLRVGITDERAFIASLQIKCVVERLSPGAALDRIDELFRRTTQFNTTGSKFSVAELSVLLGDAGGGLYAMTVCDRFADHGLVGAAVVTNGEIVGFALSCRVIGLGVEHRFLDEILADLAGRRGEVLAQIIDTSRNLPARNLYRDHGFSLREDGLWKMSLPARPEVAAPPAMAAV